MNTSRQLSQINARLGWRWSRNASLSHVVAQWHLLHCPIPGRNLGRLTLTATVIRHLLRWGALQPLTLTRRPTLC